MGTWVGEMLPDIQPGFSQFQAPHFQADPTYSVTLLPISGLGRSPMVRMGQSGTASPQWGSVGRVQAAGGGLGPGRTVEWDPIPRKTLSRTTSRSLIPQLSTSAQQ